MTTPTPKSTETAIPADVMEAARYAAILINPDMLPGEIRTIARAIMAATEAERERCVQAARASVVRTQPVAWQPKYKPEFLEHLRRVRGDMHDPLVFFPTKKEAEAYGYGGHDARPLYDRPLASSHPDDVAVDSFAAAMKVKLAKKRAEGRGGWDNPDECSVAFLSELLRSHVEKGDPVDVGNLAMMIHQREGAIE